MSETTKRYQCRHIFTDGHRCGSPCLRHEEFCYYHHTTRRPIENPGERRSRQAEFDLPLPEDRASIQTSIGEVLRRIARNEIDPKRAGLLLYGLQIASSNLPRTTGPRSSSKREATRYSSRNEAADTETSTMVEEIVLDPTYGTLAPRAEVAEPEERKSVVALLLENLKADLHEHRIETPQEHDPEEPEPDFLPTLQACEQSPAGPARRARTLRLVVPRLEVQPSGKGQGKERGQPPNPPGLYLRNASEWHKSI